MDLTRGAAVGPRQGAVDPERALDGIYVEKVFEDTEQLLQTLERAQVRP